MILKKPWIFILFSTLAHLFLATQAFQWTNDFGASGPPCMQKDCLTEQMFTETPDIPSTLWTFKFKHLELSTRQVKKFVAYLEGLECFCERFSLVLFSNDRNASDLGLFPYLLLCKETISILWKSWHSIWTWIFSLGKYRILAHVYG